MNNEEARFRIRYTYSPPLEQGYVNDGDQDAAAWEGTAEKAHEVLLRLRQNARPGETFALVEVLPPLDQADVTGGFPCVMATGEKR